MKKLAMMSIVIALCGCTYFGREKAVQSIFDNPAESAPVVSADETNDSVIITEVTHGDE